VLQCALNKSNELYLKENLTYNKTHSDHTKIRFLNCIGFTPFRHIKLKEKQSKSVVTQLQNFGIVIEVPCKISTPKFVLIPRKISTQKLF
jgi:hypothetical protein